MLKEMSKMFVDMVTRWLETTKDFDIKRIEEQITSVISKYLLRGSNRNPVVKPNIIVID